jgi:Ca2+-binding RTX toxin-like protein
MTINPFSPILDTAVGNVIQVLSNSTVAPPSAGTIAFSNSQFSINENGIPVTQVTLTRTGGSTGAVSATLNLSNGTATAGNDYIQTPITVTFADGETSKTVDIPIINDKIYEGDETLNLTLSNPTGGATLGTQQTATLTIVDNEQLLFTDNFDNGTSPLWGNEVGNWQQAQGVYDSQAPSNSPLTYSSLPYLLKDFSIELDINKVQDGGVFLRSTDNNNGVLLVTGGYARTGTGFYWHTIQNGVLSQPPLNPSASGLFQSGISNIHLRIEVVGDNYSVFLNNNPTPVTTLTTSLFSSGKVALYDFSELQTFDNIKIAVEEDILTGTANDDNLIGTPNNDTIIGLAGNDKLDGKAGSDNLQGGTGNDIYTIDNLGDVVTENLNEGTDTVRSYITYTLGNNLENLTLLGGSSLSGTGNELNNTLLGNNGNNTLIGGAGNDILDGQAGNDIMQGGLGNDTYTLSSAGDVVTENANEGTDTVKTYLTYTLGNNLENLTLLGNADIDGTGNSLNNSLTGNNFNNTLSGGDGNDTLNGTIGNDTLIGGNGNDFAYYYNATDSVIVNLATGTANDGQDGIDTLSQIENVQGSNTAGDNLTGNTGVNVLYGYGGADILTGGGGNDLLYLGSDTVKDTVNYTSGDGVDTVYNFVRGASGDLLKFTGITAIDIQVSGTSTLFKVGDGISSNTGFGSGTLLLTTSATTGFVAADVNVNLLGATFAFS